ncbi:MAG: amidohydrolase family protein, partial [Paraglaciecola sp.]|nr:amidohydrolase family protein [Paraglaciecola sp.]
MQITSPILEAEMRQGYRAQILHFPQASASPKSDYVFLIDGLLVTRNDKIEFIGDYKSNINQYDNLKIVDYSGKLLLPGFIDSHMHFPQTEMLASFGEQLLDWLTDYTFPV